MYSVVKIPVPSILHETRGRLVRHFQVLHDGVQLIVNHVYAPLQRCYPLAVLNDRFRKRLDLLAVVADRFRQTQQRRLKTVHLVKHLILRVLQYLVFPLHALESNIGCGCHASPFVRIQYSRAA